MAQTSGSQQTAMSRSGSSENWGSRLGVILAVAGSAVGLGNFLRFPGQAALNGGGVFMIPYFVSLILLGIPICWVEWTMGRYGGSRGFNSAPGIFSVLWRSPISKYFGALALIVPVGIYMYYVYIEAWCLAYAWDYARGHMSSYGHEVAAHKKHFSDFVGMEYNGFLLRSGGLQESVVFLVIVFVLNFVLIYRGLSKGIETFCKFAMPLLLVIALIVLGRVLTLGTPDPTQPDRNINNALGYMWNSKVPLKYEWEQIDGPAVELSSSKAENPTFTAPVLPAPQELRFRVQVSGGLKSEEATVSTMVQPPVAAAVGENGSTSVLPVTITLAPDRKTVEPVQNQPTWTALADPELWLAAAGQIFFSLSVGFGIILNYASYLKKHDDVVLSGLTASSTNEFCEVCLGGLITLPVAFLFLSAADLTKDVLGSGMSLGFMALPAVFARMPAGDLFGAMWFFMLFLAAITSSLSMLQPAIAFFEEGFGMGRRFSVTCLGLLTAIGGLLVVYFSKGLIGLDVMDFWIGTVCIFILATVQVITVGWIFGIPKAREEAKRGAALNVPEAFWFIIKYISPAYLLVIFGGWCLLNIPSKIREIQGMATEDRGTVLLMLAFILVLLIFFGLLVNLAGKRWVACGKLSCVGDGRISGDSADDPTCETGRRMDS